MEMTATLDSEMASKTKRLDGGAAVMAPIKAVFTSDRVRVEVTVDVADGAPTCRGYTVEPVGDVGLELMTDEVMRGINLRALMLNAFAAINPNAVDTLFDSLKRRRSPITDEKLRHFADMYRLKFVPGCMDEFAKEMNVGERQARRLLALARQRGFLPPKGS